MAQSSQDRYRKAQERAQALGFDSDYARRRAALEAQGTTPRRARNASESRRGISRDYWAESVSRERLARRRGFATSGEERSAKRGGLEGKALETAKKKSMLKHFGITEAAFNRMRRENDHWYKMFPMLRYGQINEYRRDIDKDIHNWSEDRVGYIIYFNAAIVNPASNYDSAKLNPKFVPRGSEPRRLLNTKEQFRYLVKYAHIYSQDEFESRYGRVLPD